MKREDFPANSCLIIVDPQNDFVTGALAVPGAAVALLRAGDYAYMFDANGDPVVITQDFHKPDHPSFHAQGGPWPEHCVIDTWGQRLYFERWEDYPQVLKAYEEESYSGFEKTHPHRAAPLDLFLKYHNVKNVFIAGLALDYCVKNTAIDAKSLGYFTNVLLDATAAVASDSGTKALETLKEWDINLIS